MSELNVEALQERIATLEGELAEKNRIPGVPDGLDADVRRRVAAGLPLHHAIPAAISQAANDKRVAEEEAAAKKAAAAKAADEKAAANRMVKLEAENEALKAALQKKAA